MAFYRGGGGSLDGLTESEVILISISQGGTGASTASGARTNLGLGTAATTDASAYATAAQGALADSATQPGDLGTAAAEDVDYFATAAQGALADSAVQPGDLATVATTGSYNDLLDLPTAGTGTVTSVALSAPTGLTVSGSPVTTSGTLALTFTSGYSIPTTSKQTNWDTAYGWGNHASAGYLTSYTETDPVYVASSWYSTTNNSTNWNTAYGWGNHALAGYLTFVDNSNVDTTGVTEGYVLSANGTGGATWEEISSDLVNDTTPQLGGDLDLNGWVIRDASGPTIIQSSTDYNIEITASGDGDIVLTPENGVVSIDGNEFPTTSGSSGQVLTTNGAGVLSWGTLNTANWDTAYGWGNHASAGYLTSETYTGTVTSVGMTVPTGLSVSGSPVTSSGTLAVTFSAGYSIPTTSSQGNWDTAYGWGNHASAGYLTSSSTLDASKLSGNIDGGTF